ncbi:phenylalanine--tRNA ligase beta subunit-related protein [Pandoraea sp.]|uniref:B3/B4 domain-containing protein n=1 Tax=Pandoraea sp. TaxID=1883445 RepID=UPI0025D39958|nr:phenylalanine--tRNA ligase beta subunit-related protein [Pandoraea sp.]
MGLKPPQFRCASDSLLRCVRKAGRLPPIHPLIDLCNAVSIAFAAPIAVFDASRVDGDLEARHAQGNEAYAASSGEPEYPDPGEVIFADCAGRAHARRWTHRQSARSAVRHDTVAVLIVAEGVLASAGSDVLQVIAAAREGSDEPGWQTRKNAILSQAWPTFEF